MAKKKKKIFTDKNTDALTSVLNDFNERLLQIENFAILQSKLLNANILNVSALIYILIDKGILTEQDIRDKSQSILDELKIKTSDFNESAEKFESILKSVTDSDDMGHA